MLVIYFILSVILGAVAPEIAPIFSIKWWAIVLVPHIFFVIGSIFE